MIKNIIIPQCVKNLRQVLVVACFLSNLGAFLVKLVLHYPKTMFQIYNKTNFGCREKN